MSALLDEFGGDVLKHFRRHANIVDALELSDGDQQAVKYF
ncbi:hypothetical protein C4K03_4767 [Pseudomonas synxantha]|uniref:Uncharacterized protein n=1 Tax=Pseudomonas synxantha TaxID=47883 RepID=A0A3G7UC17_9PSED|nr:hypothetical protein C4K03_4767 [Pseudomonas synxantha]